MCVWGTGLWHTGLSMRKAAHVEFSLIFYELSVSTDVYIAIYWQYLLIFNESVVVRVYPI